MSLITHYISWKLIPTLFESVDLILLLFSTFPSELDAVLYRLYTRNAAEIVRVVSILMQQKSNFARRNALSVSHIFQHS